MRGLAYRCQRCNAVVGEPHPDPEVALRRAVETNALHTFHRCPDGGTGICRLVGTTTEHATVAEALASSTGGRVTPAAVYVVGVLEAVLRGDWALAKWCAKEAVLARVSALYDDGHDVVIPAPERPLGGAEHAS